MNKGGVFMQSIWSDSVKNSNINNQKKLNGDIKTDVLIISGGLAMQGQNKW